jgi:hypothetical protein
MRRWWLAILSMIVAFVVLVGTTVIPFDNGFRSLAQMQPASETHQLRELAESLLVYPFPTLLTFTGAHSHLKDGKSNKVNHFHLAFIKLRLANFQ